MSWNLALICVAICQIFAEQRSIYEDVVIKIDNQVWIYEDTRNEIPYFRGPCEISSLIRTNDVEIIQDASDLFKPLLDRTKRTKAVCGVPFVSIEDFLSHVRVPPIRYGLLDK